MNVIVQRPFPLTSSRQWRGNTHPYTPLERGSSLPLARPPSQREAVEGEG